MVRGNVLTGDQMSFNATRLTCFALISAIETDCREALLAIDAENDVVVPTDARDAALSRLTRDRKVVGDGLDVLVQYLDFADAYQTLLANKVNLTNTQREALAAMAPQLQALIQVRNRVAHSRPMEIGDLSLTLDIANELVALSSFDWSATYEVVNRLHREPSFVLGLTVELPVDPLNQPQHNLPIPDFDETGFFGRAAELKRIKKALLGAYPVVSVLGDGGIGKTAIALKVAYDLLDAANSPFDAIVWASAKSTTLTDREISTISGAIQDSLGLFEAAAQELAGEIVTRTSADPMEELLEYLEQFRVLLILDNLETVTDHRLRSFLLDLPLGSKVLLTSRIGLGIENPVKLEPLTVEESKRLLRTLAGIRGIDVFKEMSDEALTRFVGKLRGHPLYVKWLVSGVQAGRRPADLVNDNSLLLDFCMSNVWDKLTQSARTVLQAMQIARGPRNMAELAYLTSMSAEKIQAAVLGLMTTNFATMRHVAEGDLEGVFEPGEFASQYLAKHQPPSAGLRSQVTSRLRELEDLGRDFMAESRADPFDPFTIDVRERADVPTARLLHTAVRELRAENYDMAFSHCAEAQILSPTYGEVWRIQGLIRWYRQDINTAAEDFQTALEHADKSAIMAFHVANFYIDGANEPESALRVINDALQVHSRNAALLHQLADVSFRMGRYRDAVGACSILAGIPQTTISGHTNSILCLRGAVFGVEDALWKNDLGVAAQLLEDMAAALEKISASDMDVVAADWLLHLSALSARMRADANGNESLSTRGAQSQQAFAQRARIIDPTRLSRMTGQIRRMDETKRFGFIGHGEHDYFFHRNDLVVRDDWNSLAIDTLVAFDPEVAQKGRHGVRVQPLL